MASLHVRLFGMGATRADVLQAVAVGAAGAGLAAAFQVRADAALWLVALAAVIAFDLFGGCVVNASAPGKRWYHRPGTSRLRPIGFAALHVHPVVLTVTPGGLAVDAGVALYMLAIGGVAFIVLVPRPYRAASAIGACALLIGIAVAVPTPLAWQWLPAVFLLKLVAAHAVPPHVGHGAAPMETNA